MGRWFIMNSQIVSLTNVPVIVLVYVRPLIQFELFTSLEFPMSTENTYFVTTKSIVNLIIGCFEMSKRCYFLPVPVISEFQTGCQKQSIIGKCRFNVVFWGKKS